MSANFDLNDFLRSETAERDPALRAQQMAPSAAVIANLQRLVKTTLQPIRDNLGYPIVVSSGYRCPAVNRAVGSSDSSQHLLGEAADCGLSAGFLDDPAAAGRREFVEARVRDITGRGMPDAVNANFYLFAFIACQMDRYDVDQVIHEYGPVFGAPAWVHVAASGRQDKRQALLVGGYTGKRFLAVTVEQALSGVLT